MPEIGEDVLAIMNLHARCRENKCLPHSGGLLDQDAYLMDLFDVIDSARDQFHRKERERMRDAEAAAEMFRGAIRG